MSGVKATPMRAHPLVIERGDYTDAQVRTFKKRWVALSRGRRKRIPILNTKLIFQAFKGEELDAAKKERKIRGVCLIGY